MTKDEALAKFQEMTDVDLVAAANETRGGQFLIYVPIYLTPELLAAYALAHGYDTKSGGLNAEAIIEAVGAGINDDLYVNGTLDDGLPKIVGELIKEMAECSFSDADTTKKEVVEALLKTSKRED